MTTSASLRRCVGLVYETSDVTLLIVIKQETAGCAGGDDGGDGIAGGCVAFTGVGGGVGGRIGGSAGAGASEANDALMTYWAVGPACTSVFAASSSMV